MYAILGATGNTGSIVAETLLAAGQSIRVIVRSEEKGRAWAERGAAVAVADAFDLEALTDALRGVTGAYLLLPPDVQSDDFLGGRRKLADTLAQAVERSGLSHAVLLSSIGAQHAQGTGVIRSLHYLEQRMRATGISLSVIRAAYFLENWAAVLPMAKSQGVLPSMIAPVDRAIPMVSTRDIGETAARALQDPPAGVRIIELAGSAELSPLDLAALASKTLGRDVSVHPVPYEAQVETFQQFGISGEVAGLFVELNRGIEQGLVDFEGGSAEHLRGARAASEWLAEVL